jgi:hypothetical protein
MNPILVLQNQLMKIKILELKNKLKLHIFLTFKIIFLIQKKFYDHFNHLLRK